MDFEQARRVMDAASASAGATVALFECRDARDRGEASDQDVIDVVTDYIEKQRAFENTRNSKGVF